MCIARTPARYQESCKYLEHIGTTSCFNMPMTSYALSHTTYFAGGLLWNLHRPERLAMTTYFTQQAPKAPKCVFSSLRSPAVLVPEDRRESGRVPGAQKVISSPKKSHSHGPVKCLVLQDAPSLETLKSIEQSVKYVSLFFNFSFTECLQYWGFA